jgi:quercetin 2,3-dioxygenase
MIIHQPAHIWPGREHGPFRIRRMRPGFGLNIPGDEGLGPLGTVDRASLSPGLVVPMHEHVDDEILSYLRSGIMHHEDPTGELTLLSPRNLMLMNSGSGFSHQEGIPSTEAGKTEMLQIFVRPSESGLSPMVQFHPFEDLASSAGAWRLISGPTGSTAPLHLRNQVWVHDSAVRGGDTIELPSAEGHTRWLHLFSGSGSLGQQSMTAGDSAIIENELSCSFEATEDSVLVLFTVNRTAPYTRRGSLSG